ncbi:hypothetical protein C8Q70DRAFT_925142 [Cubamyces menziesii]|uniref:ABM domain-containing protein n=1 Tax=Trametes cubensis TaxID=1111947 RepID=A0AAD7XA57_9APHY|nr:hypothetical protein C8Q70DRAFT_925142 [Cubamyces menziesii]KAJ8480929.1 hypothetical protein ONZ51_g6348 [Trametes cubensis]
MSLPTIEVVWKEATEAFRANPKDRSLVKESFDILSAQQGQLQKYFGVKHEDNATAYGIISWATMEDHQRLMDNKELYPVLGKATASWFKPDGPPTMLHVRPTSEPYKAFEAPVTEIAWFTLKEGQSKSELEQLVDTLAKAIGAAGEAKGVYSPAWGPTVEKDNVLGLFIGWSSVQTHWDFVTSDKASADLIAKIKTIADVDLVHIPFTKW